MKTIVITLFNQKGGVSKTTTCSVLGDYYADRGERVLLVDLDTQANLTITFADPEDLDLDRNVYTFLENKKIDPASLVVPIRENLFLLPADGRLRTKSDLDSAFMLENYVDPLEDLFASFNKVIIDCPPALNAMASLGIMLSHYVVMPVAYHKYCYVGLDEALNTIKTYRRFNPLYRGFVSFGSQHSKRKQRNKEDYRNRYIDELGENFILESLPSYVGLDERADIMDSIFKYAEYNPAADKDGKIPEIRALCDRLDEIFLKEKEAVRG